MVTQDHRQRCALLDHQDFLSETRKVCEHADTPLCHLIAERDKNYLVKPHHSIGGKDPMISMAQRDYQ